MVGLIASCLDSVVPPGGNVFDKRNDSAAYWVRALILFEHIGGNCSLCLSGASALRACGFLCGHGFSSFRGWLVVYFNGFYCVGKIAKIVLASPLFVLFPPLVS